MTSRRPAVGKIEWHGRLTSVQPRIRLLRSFDQRHHNYLGYVLFLTGMADGENRDFSVAVGKAAQQKHSFSAGMNVKGMAVPVADPRIEVAEFYKVSGIKVTGDEPPSIISGPPRDVIHRRRLGRRRRHGPPRRR